MLPPWLHALFWSLIDTAGSFCVGMVAVGLLGFIAWLVAPKLYFGASYGRWQAP